MTGVFQSAGLRSLKFDVALILFAWVGSNLMTNRFDARSKYPKIKRLNRIEVFILIPF